MVSKFQPQLLQDFPPFRLSETAAANRCHICASTIWTLVTQEPMGYRVHLDTTLLQLPDQLAILGKRATFTIWRSDAGFEVTPRSFGRIIFDKGNALVLAEHDCSKFTNDWPNYFPTQNSTQLEEAQF
jgi:hypothetical protein